MSIPTKKLTFELQKALKFVAMKRFPSDSAGQKTNLGVLSAFDIT